MIEALFVIGLVSQGSVPASLPALASPSATEILVVAQRNEQALARCLAVGCPPIDDIKASIAVAEQQFVAGDYRQARSTLARSISRNKGYSDELPTAVAALYEASANVNLHYGDQWAYRRNVGDRVRIMRTAAPEGSSQQVLAATLLGDMWLALGDVTLAEQGYRSAGAQARALGHPRLAAYIDLRRVAVRLSAANTRGAAKLLSDVARGAYADDPGVRATLSSMRIRLASARKDGSALDRALAELAALPPGAAPILVFAEPIPLSANEAAEARRAEWRTPTGAIPVGSNAISWIDVGFYIGPDGRTDDVEILRGQMSYERSREVLRHIVSRRYAPFTPDDGASGTYRVERYTLRSPIAGSTGSLIRRRGGPAQIEMIDITRTPAAPPIG